MSRHNLGWSDKRVDYGEAGSPGLLLVLTLAALILAGLICGATAAAEPVTDGKSSIYGSLPDDPDGKRSIIFNDRHQRHFYFKNRHAGELLVLTGRVRNNYPESRGSIKLRGYLLSSADQTLDDRVAYAGNTLSEEELVDLPLYEITRRLMNQYGRNEANAKVMPGAEIDFMLVLTTCPTVRRNIAWM